MKINDALSALEECEAKLRKLMGSAASEGDYGNVVKLTSWARVIGGLVDDAKMERTPTGVTLNLPSQFNLANGEPNENRSTLAKKGQKAPRTKPRGYPRFFRTGKDLIKIGWSKRDRAEYQHKAPYTVLMLLVSKLTVVGARGSIFAAENVFPLETDDGTPIPNYQAYLCLAWLRQEGLVDSHGRQGYTLPNGNFSGEVSSKWNGLQSWRG